jgi:hypothetical protein
MVESKLYLTDLVFLVINALGLKQRKQAGWQKAKACKHPELLADRYQTIFTLIIRTEMETPYLTLNRF